MQKWKGLLGLLLNYCFEKYRGGKERGQDSFRETKSTKQLLDPFRSLRSVWHESEYLAAALKCALIPTANDGPNHECFSLTHWQCSPKEPTERVVCASPAPFLQTQRAVRTSD